MSLRVALRALYLLCRRQAAPAATEDAAAANAADTVVAAECEAVRDSCTAVKRESFASPAWMAAWGRVRGDVGLHNVTVDGGSLTATIPAGTWSPAATQRAGLPVGGFSVKLPLELRGACAGLRLRVRFDGDF